MRGEWARIAARSAGSSGSPTVCFFLQAFATVAATGRPAISGTVRVGEMLTASPGNIDDHDGVTLAVCTYQWFRVDGNTPATGVPEPRGSARVGR